MCGNLENVEQFSETLFRSTFSLSHNSELFSSFSQGKTHSHNMKMLGKFSKIVGYPTNRTIHVCFAVSKYLTFLFCMKILFLCDVDVLCRNFDPLNDFHKMPIGSKAFNRVQRRFLSITLRWIYLMASKTAFPIHLIEQLPPSCVLSFIM